MTSFNDASPASPIRHLSTRHALSQYPGSHVTRVTHAAAYAISVPGYARDTRSTTPQATAVQRFPQNYTLSQHRTFHNTIRYLSTDLSTALAGPQHHHTLSRTAHASADSTTRLRQYRTGPRLTRLVEGLAVTDSEQVQDSVQPTRSTIPAISTKTARPYQAPDIS
eukprot:725450-Rhodomonas_salina.4